MDLYHLILRATQRDFPWYLSTALYPLPTSIFFTPTWRDEEWGHRDEGGGYCRTTTGILVHENQQTENEWFRRKNEKLIFCTLLLRKRWEDRVYEKEGVRETGGDSDQKLFVCNMYFVIEMGCERWDRGVWEREGVKEIDLDIMAGGRKVTERLLRGRVSCTDVCITTTSVNYSLS